MRLGFPNAGEPLSDDVVRQGPESRERVTGNSAFLSRIDPLGAIGQKPHPQHRMPHRQVGGRRRANVRDRLPRRRIRHTDARPHHRAADCRGARPTWRAASGRAEMRRRVSPVARRPPRRPARQCSCSAPHQQRPCLDGGVGGQRGEVDVDTATTPPTGERHHPNRVETLADEVAAGVDGIGADAEQFGDLSAHVAGLPATEAPTPPVNTPNPPTS